MLARPLVAAALLVAAGLGSVLAGGTSSATSPVTAPAYGPFVRVPAEPLVRADGPVLPARPAPVAAPMGPRGGAVVVGPPGLVGPDSPPARVRAVQRLLNRAGAQLRVDGAWGPATTRAVEAVQRRAGLPVTGRVGPQTLALLSR